MEVVVHLGADPSPLASWESTLSNNIIGTRNVYESARQAGARRVILASTNHVIGYYPLKDDPYKAIYDGRLSEVRRPFRLLDHHDMRPDSFYGVSKAFGEVLGSFYHDEYGLSVICLRIGVGDDAGRPDFPSCRALAVDEPQGHGPAHSEGGGSAKVCGVRHSSRYVQQRPEISGT